MAAGLKHAPEFNMFGPKYIFDLDGFAVRMSSTYVQILLTLQPFTAGDIVKFQLTPKEYLKQENSIQFNYLVTRDNDSPRRARPKAPRATITSHSRTCTPTDNTAAASSRH